MSKILEIKNLSVSYGGIEAIKNISFDVEAGSIVTLIGSNGAGKSSTLRSIAGIVKAKSGEVLFEGENILGLSPDQIVKRVTEKVQPGSIVLFHNAAKHTPEALPAILETLLQEGYTFLPISDLLLPGQYGQDYTIDHTGRQCPA